MDNPSLGDVTALALWTSVIVAYIRTLLRLSGLWGPVLAVAVAVALALGAWVLGLGSADWRSALVLGIQGALAAMGGYSGLKALVERWQARTNGG